MALQLKPCDGFFAVGDTCKAGTDEYTVAAIVEDPLSNNWRIVLVKTSNGNLDWCNSNGTMTNGYEFITEIENRPIQNLYNQLRQVIRATYNNEVWDEITGHSPINLAYSPLGPINTIQLPSSSPYGNGYAPGISNHPSLTRFGIASSAPNGVIGNGLNIVEFIGAVPTCICPSQDLFNYGCKCGYSKSLKS